MIFMEIIGPVLITTFAALSTVLGSLLIFVKIKKVDEFITFCLSFSLSVMFTMSIVELLPNSSKIIINNFGFNGILYILIVFFIGVLIINLMEKSIKKHSTNSNLYRVGLLSMIALMIHNFPEGIATFMTSVYDIKLGISLGIAIMLHNIPEGISIAVPIYYSTSNKLKSVGYTLISGLSELLGAILCYIFIMNYINDILISFVLIFVSGIMITLSINKMLPEVLKYNKKKYMNIGLISGVVLVLINYYLF